jgi:hypothetical protein
MSKTASRSLLLAQRCKERISRLAKGKGLDTHLRPHCSSSISKKLVHFTPKAAWHHLPWEYFVSINAPKQLRHTFRLGANRLMYSLVVHPKTLFCATGALFGEVVNQPGAFLGLQVDRIFSPQELDVSLVHKLDLGQGTGGFLHACPAL